MPPRAPGPGGHPAEIGGVVQPGEPIAKCPAVAACSGEMPAAFVTPAEASKE
jgi:hypothetical protein